MRIVVSGLNSFDDGRSIETLATALVASEANELNLGRYRAKEVTE